MVRRHETPQLLLSIVPVVTIFAAFFILPFARLLIASFEGPLGAGAYTAIVTDPRYYSSLVSTIVLAFVVTLTTLLISGFAGVFLDRNHFRGRAVVVAALTLPLAFPGVVVGFMVIMLAGRQGLIGEIAKLVSGQNLVFAYSIAGLFVGYVYFSIPRVILTVMAAAEKLDRNLEEASRSLGASSWRVIVDVIIPGLMPALLSAGAFCFATAMGAFGTAFTLATDINVLPMTIYTDFTQRANIASAAAMSVVLGAITWAVLAIARTAAGNTVAAAG
jgi:putative spermidine/putrescine transport system permease protein